MTMPYTELSLVIPLYNKSERIAACLGSVLAQNLPLAKILVIDDGSSDDSAAIVAQIAQDHPSLELIRQANAGVSAARNAGWRAIDTPYVAFLDADDAWLPDFTKQAQALIKACPQADLFGFAHKKQDARIGTFSPSLGLPVSHFGYVQDYFQSAAKGSLVNSSSVVVRRQALEAIGGFPEGETLGEDLYTWARLVLDSQSKQPMAFDGQPSSLVYQFEDQSRHDRDTRLPYVMSYFAARPEDIARNPSLKAYIWRISWLHVLGAIEEGKSGTARKRAKLVRNLFGFKGWALRALSLLPAWIFQPILSWVKQRRRQRGA